MGSAAAHEELVALCERIGTRPVFITGNHDPTVSDRHYLDLCDGRFFATHGDLLFPTVTPWSREVEDVLPDIDAIRESYGDALHHDLDVAVQCLQETRAAIRAHPLRAHGTNLISRLIWSAGEFWPPKRTLGILHAWRTTPHRAREIARAYRPEAECVLIGHTHRRQVSAGPGPAVLNTGAFASGLGRYVGEIVDGELHVLDVRRQGEGWRFAGRHRLGG